MQAMIERYVKLVGQNLPAAVSEDLQKELHSLIEDTLEDDSQAAGRPVDEEMVVAVLARMGRPEKVAASYLPPRFLIGPELFPHFITTLKIVLTVVTILAMVGLGFSLVLQTGQAAGIGETLLRVLTGLGDAVFRAAAVVVLVFAIMQWAGTRLKTQEKPWDPRKMPAEADPQRIKIGEQIVEMILAILLLILLNFYPNWIGMLSIQEGGWVSAPVLTEAFFRYLPWINGIFALDLVKNILLVYNGRWTTALRWYAVLIGGGTILVAGWMLSGPALAAIDPAVFNRLGDAVFSADTLARLNTAANLGVRAVIAIVLVVEVVELAQNLYTLLLKKRMPVLGGAPD